MISSFTDTPLFDTQNLWADRQTLEKEKILQIREQKKIASEQKLSALTQGRCAIARVVEMNPIALSVVQMNPSLSLLRIDNVAVVSGDCVLLAGQINKTENGLWIAGQSGSH